MFSFCLFKLNSTNVCEEVSFQDQESNSHHLTAMLDVVAMLPTIRNNSLEIQTFCWIGSGCDSVGRAVASDARGLWFESSHLQTFISDIYLFTVNCIEKTKIKKKRPGMAH